jgi:hypothetical protein
MAKAKKEPNWQENELPNKRMFDQMDKIRKEEASKKPTKMYGDEDVGMKKGGKVKKYARGGGIESKGKTRGRVR